MRSYAQVVTSIWTDPDFCQRSAGAQRTYFMLFSQPEISAAGVLPLTTKRWALTVKASERKNMAGWLAELTGAGFIVIDQTTEELLVRSFIKWDHGYTNTKRIPVIKDGMRAVRSPELARVLLNEAQKLGLDVSGLFPQVNTLSDALNQPTPENPDSQYRIDRVVVTEVSSTHNPQTTTNNPSSGSRGIRIDPDWQASPRLIEWAKSECPTVDGRAETPKFVDWWIQKSGKDALKSDWDAAFRTWMRRARDQGPPPTRTGPQRSTTDDRVAATLALAGIGTADLPRQIGSGR